MADIAVLSAELSADPLGRGYAGMTAQAAADDLNTAYRARMVPLGSRVVLEWLAQAGRYRRVEAAANDVTKPEALRTVCAVALLLVRREDTEVDVTRHSALIDALVAGGVITTAERNELASLAREMISRGTELSLGEVRPGDVQYARGEI